nr:reverse transcriptase domain-containing protein [Tanacetum cinerariifolium]
MITGRKEGSSKNTYSRLSGRGLSSRFVGGSLKDVLIGVEGYWNDQPANLTLILVSLRVSRDKFAYKEYGDEVSSPTEHPKEKYNLDTATKLSRGKPNKRSGDVDLSKDKSGPESTLELQRSWTKHTTPFQTILYILRIYLTIIVLTLTSELVPDSHPGVKKVGRPEHNQGKRRERSKSKKKTYRHQETSLYSEYEEGSDDACEDLNLPYKRPKPTPFIQRIACFKYHKREKLPWIIMVYEGNKDPEDHLDPKSVDSFEELSQKFMEEFSQQKRYAKDPTKIHGSEPSLGEKWPLGQQKWSVLLKGTKDTFIWHGSEDLKEPKTGATQGKYEGIWDCTLLIPKKMLSLRLPRIQKKSSPWKA